MIEVEREFKLKELENNDRIFQYQTDERVISQLQNKVQELETKLLDGILR